MSDGQSDVQRTIDANNTRTGGADWQSGDGWGYLPLNEAAVAQQMRRAVADMQQLANATAAVGMGRGRYPEWSEELASLARRLHVWADAMNTDAANAAESGRSE